MKNITRALVLPLLSAGVIGGAALGLAGPALPIRPHPAWPMAH